MRNSNPVSTPGPKACPVDAETVRRAAFGRWSDILQALGMSAEVLAKKRNQPCPACGGTDRFQFIDKGQGRFVCRGLDSMGGDGFTLVQHWLGCDFKTALQAIAATLGLSADIGLPTTPARPEITPKRAAVDPERQRDKLAATWHAAKPVTAGDPVGSYLAQRGLDMAVYPEALRHHHALPYWIEVDGQPQTLGSYPALLAAVTSPAGDLAGLHRIYLTADGHKAAPVHPVTGAVLPCRKLTTVGEGSMQGAGVRLYGPENGVLAVAEGIETALAARVGSGLPCWAAVSAWGLQNIVLPESVTDAYVMGDNDISGTGQRAAHALARRMQEEERQVRVEIPSRPGDDWLDVLNERQRIEVA